MQLHCSYSLCREAANLLGLQIVTGSVLSKGAGKDVSYVNLEKNPMLKFCKLLFFIQWLGHLAAKAALTI